MTERLTHATTGTVLADQVTWAKGSLSRARGLIGSTLEPGDALVICPAKQVHTFFMRHPIDVIFCDGSWDVLHAISPMLRRRVSRWVAGARFVVELPPGTAAKVRAGDRLQLDL